MAISGRFVTTDKIKVPPKAAPKPNSASMYSTTSDSLLQKYQMAMAETKKNHNLTS